MARVTSSTPPSDHADPVGAPERSGRTFVIISVVFLALFLGFLLLVSPVLQDRLGLSGDRGFPVPDAPVEVPLTLGGQEVGVAIWDDAGVCAEITDSAGTTFRTCAVPDPLRPIWAIDAPDEAADGYLLVATPPAVIDVAGSTTDGETLAGLTQARELPAAWALIPLPDGAVVDQLTAFNSSNSDVGGAQCGVPEAPTGGSDRLNGGCVVPQED